MSATAYLLIGIVTGWPPAIGGMWLTWYLANRKVQQVTDQQNKFIARLTRDQTTAILGHEDHGMAAGDV